MTRLPETTPNTAAQAGSRHGVESGRRAAAPYWPAWLLGGFVWGIGVWLLEGGQSMWSHAPNATELLRSSRATLFFYELAGITAALVAGLWWAGVCTGRTSVTWVAHVRERWTELERGPVEARRAILARTYAVVCVVPACLVLAFYAARDAALRIANRDNLGLASVAIQVVVLLFGLAAVRVAERSIHYVIGWLESTPAEKFHRLGWHAAVVLVLGSSLLAGVVTSFWQPFAELFRRFAAPVLLGLVSAGGCARLAPHLRVRRRAGRATSLGILALFALSGFSGALVRDTTLRTWAEAPIARLAVGWGHVWLDWDRDTHLSGFGERDCAPFDASRHPGALDLPGNRSDEDCDGVDARFEARASTRPMPPSARRTDPGTRSIRPNLYLITIDALAVGTLEAYGGTAGVAPFLDGFAKRAVVFENFFVQGPSTRLSLPALFTSRFDTRIDHVLAGRFPFELAPSNRTLAEVLAEAGYDTLAVIPSPYFAPEHWRGLLQGFQSVSTRPAEASTEGVPHTASAVTMAALELMNRPRDEPLFLWAHYFDAHPPHLLPAGQPARGSADADLYAAEVTHLDGHVGRLIDHIVTHDPNHVVVVTSDHGMAFDEPRHERDHYGYDLSTLVLHVPFMVQAATLAPARITRLTDALDLAPTFASLAGIDPPDSFMGHSLVPLLLGEPSNLPAVRFAQLYLGEEALRGREPLVMVAARTAEHNLVFDRRSGTFSAWRWQEDREERRDRWPAALAGAPPEPSAAHEETIKLRALRSALDAHLYEVVAPRSALSHRSHNETDPK
ncbi:MAG TPA: sulfatase [Polyangiaceae bacterium]|nr:sulfatase [Polyangiaceae bacterium]